MGSVLIERNALEGSKKALFNKNVYQDLLVSEVRDRLHVIAEEEFKKAGGTLKMLKSECKGNVVTYEEDYVEINKTFTQCFPNMQMGKNYYVDSEAYWIEEIEVANDEEGERICNVNGADEKC